jgi:hypothetical protein
MLRWLKTVVVSDAEKGARDASGGDQEDGCAVSKSRSLLKCRNWIS